MGILDLVYRNPEDAEKKEPERKIIVDKRYHICVEDNPMDRFYVLCGKETFSPGCKISLHASGLTFPEAKEIERDIRAVLEDHGFILR